VLIKQHFHLKIYGRKLIKIVILIINKIVYISITNLKNLLKIILQNIYRIKNPALERTFDKIFVINSCYAEDNKMEI